MPDQGAEHEGDSPRDPGAGDAPAPRGAPAPPRAFDAEPDDLLPTASSTQAAEDEPALEIIDEHAEPEQGALFENLEDLPALLEALLFVADHPLDEGYLGRALDVSTARVRTALDTLEETLRDGQRGIRLQRGPEGAQLVSAPEAAPHIERFLGLEANRRLSTAALETLAIIAYRQPVTRGQIDAIRGVSSDGAVQTLRARNLVEPAGHASGPGRPMLLRTTQRFLEHFGLERPAQLPALPDDLELPASEISEQLGLDHALVEQVLAEAAGRTAHASDTAAETGEPQPRDREPVDDDGTAPDPDDRSDAGVDISHSLDALTAAAEQAFATAPVSHERAAEASTEGDPGAEPEEREPEEPPSDRG